MDDEWKAKQQREEEHQKRWEAFWNARKRLKNATTPNEVSMSDLRLVLDAYNPEGYSLLKPT